ncbi:putative phosphatase regulatory subunit-domain-containing protein [Gorgonomyces haynaldii]|nr:putative phosphatase regulatory subunit-domain-containing protein [Gorgonomyces haynaldii]
MVVLERTASLPTSIELYSFPKGSPTSNLKVYSLPTFGKNPKASISCPTFDFVSKSNGPKPILKQRYQKSFPARKKSLSFAPTIEVVCHFVKTNAPSAIADLDRVLVSDSGDVNLGSVSSALLIPQIWYIRYKSPPCLEVFEHLAVVLDSVHIINENQLKVSILVKNISYNKEVVIRHTWNQWDSFCDTPAVFDSCVAPAMNGYMGVDRFVMVLPLNDQVRDALAQSAQMEFAVRYTVAGDVYWDNNGTQNYRVLIFIVDSV